eukprot:TRINITY_DN4250_c0_g3_i1.p1 TRINITY_DN4250_c0_g3~~TRINITY_DN4250_c0_g3_i1.p1  ORF type:complete len:610 (+),score=97.24 TRINITY_DN4250_c0_g3_i1:43-1872(+)
MKGPLATMLVVATGLTFFTIMNYMHITTGRSEGANPMLMKKVQEQSKQLAEIQASLSLLAGGKSVKKLPQAQESSHEEVVNHHTDHDVVPYKTEDCFWNHHPGTSLGNIPEMGWEHCGTEGTHCACEGRVKYGRNEKWVIKAASGEVPCMTGHFAEDPAPGFVKECQCEVTPLRMDMTLEKAKASCQELAHRCKGVTCKGLNTNCGPMDGVPYLDPEPALHSYTKDCISLDHKPGGGNAGKHKIDGEPTIFVSMAAFRDRDARFTLRSMFTKARVPRRIFVGVVCQVYPEDPQCIPERWVNCSMDAGFCPSDQIRQRSFHASKAEGPTHARSLAAAMYRGEDFFLMIDAHNRFVQDWDMKLLEMNRRCASKKCVLSHYPQGLNNSDPENPHPLGTPPGTPLEGFGTVSYLCGSEFHERSIIKNSRAASVPVSFEPRPQPYTGAGLLFGPGRMIIEVPFDPFLPFLWDGEEFLYNARLWTWGYDMFSPSENILFHHYYREAQPRVWAEKSWANGKGSPAQNLSYKRLQYILAAPIKGSNKRLVPENTTDHAIIRGLPKYGLGPHRTIDQFWKFARINIKDRSGDAAMKEHSGFFCKSFSHAKGPYIVPDP